MPKPSPSSHQEPPEFTDFLWERGVGFFGIAWDFLQNYWLWIFLFVFIFGFLGYGAYRLHRRQKYIHKLWLFILFFLTKRQMIIPLIYTLAKRDKKLDNKILDELLQIRDECRSVSLRKSPEKRLKLEAKISEAVFTYFSTLEKDGALQKEPKFMHIMKDLEFIDKKLTDLQGIYNAEAAQWNKLVGMAVFKGVFWVFYLRKIERFGT